MHESLWVRVRQWARGVAQPRIPAKGMAPVRLDARGELVGQRQPPRHDGLAHASAPREDGAAVSSGTPVARVGPTARRRYATAAAKDAKRSPGSAWSSAQVTAIGASPSCER